MDPDPGAAPIWFDSHCHIQDSFAPDDADAAEVLAAELAHCFDAGVGRVVCVGTDLVTSKQALAVCEAASGGAYGRNVPEVYAAIGLHPHEASAGTAELVDLAGAAVGAHAPGLVAIGECGLDYFYEHSDRSSQRRAFAEQVGLAQRLGLTLVIHARDAWEDLFDVLGSEGVPERTVLHCFTGGPTEAARCVEAGMFVSFSGIITFKNADDVRAAATVVPLERRRGDRRGQGPRVRRGGSELGRRRRARLRPLSPPQVGKSGEFGQNAHEQGVRAAVQPD